MVPFKSHMTISITAIESSSALGTTDSVWDRYNNPAHALSVYNDERSNLWVGSMDHQAEMEISKLLDESEQYKKLDRTAQMAIAVSRRAIRKAGWTGNATFGVNIGSSRGATALFEKYYRDFLESNNVGSLASPTTTLGNISSWVAHDLRSQGPELSHSITCSTSLHAIINGIAWLESGLAQKFLVGGAEAPLTKFTLAQMQALRIYSREAGEYPCRALDLEKRNNSMVLGEGAAVATLEKGISENAIALIDGFGYATEPLEHPISISANGNCLAAAMEMACKKIDKKDIDVVVMHAPGTIKGDRAEYKALKEVFGEELPLVTSNKWKIGHCLGASGMLSVELATLMLQNQKFIGLPYTGIPDQKRDIKRVLVNAVGFGGNAVSILLKRV